jgi:hypothetical protein
VNVKWGRGKDKVERRKLKVKRVVGRASVLYPAKRIYQRQFSLIGCAEIQRTTRLGIYGKTVIVGEGLKPAPTREIQPHLKMS